MTYLPVNIKQYSVERQEEKLNTGVYSEGYFEGCIGCEPSAPEDNSYWAGYQIGCREYWAQKLGVTIPSEV